MSTLLNRLREYRKLFGAPGIPLAFRMRWGSRFTAVEVTPVGFKHPVQVRPKSCDLVALQKIWRDAEYSFTPRRSPQTIIDAGANIGFASIYFAEKFPAAKIIALEPESGNFALLKKNVAPYPNILPVRAALWSSLGEIDLFDPDLDHWAFRTRSTGEKPIDRVPAITVDELLRQHALGSIDILKMDVEGAEKEIFESSSRWIDHIGVIMIELHDRYRNGCSRAFWLATQNFEYEEHRGETIFLARKDFAPPTDSLA